MLEILEVAALLLILANLFLILVLFYLFFRAFFKFIGEDTLNNWTLEKFIPKNPFKAEPQLPENPVYTPTEEIPQGQVPIDQFEPDFNRPIKIEYEEAGEDHGMTVSEEEEKS